jgi:hypothetical protein
VRTKIKQLSEYFQERNKALLYEGSQALPPELEDSIFRSRLLTVWEGLMTLRVSREWDKVLSTQNEAPKPAIRDLGLSRTGKLITLLEVSFKDGSAEEVERIRRLVTLAREVFVIWLAAAKDCSAIEEIVPWELEDIRYHELANHNLARNIK